MANNSGFPLNLTRSSVMQRRTGKNWKVFNANTSNIMTQSVASNRPPAHNNSHSEKSNILQISGSSANQFRARPLKHWRKQRSINPESNNSNNLNNSNTNSKNLAYNYNVPGGTTNSTIKETLCDKDCGSTKTIPNWKTAIRNPRDNRVGSFNELNKNDLCIPSVPDKVNINGIPSSVYRHYTSVPVCDPQTKALNLVRSTTLISKSTNKLNNQKYYQSHAAYLRDKNKTYNRNLGTRGDKSALSRDENIKSLYGGAIGVGLFKNPYNAYNPSPDDCNDCNVVVKNYNNINTGTVKRKMWGSMDASSRIQERKMAAINKTGLNANKKQQFPDQGNAMSNAMKYSGRVGSPQTLKSKYYSPKQCQTDINLFRKSGKFTTGCKVPCPTATDPNRRCAINPDKPYRQSNYLIKTPITPQLSVEKLKSKLNLTTGEVLGRT